MADIFDYTELDNELVALIKSGVTNYGSLWRRSTSPFYENGRTGRDRAVDRRLQALRKKGVIDYDRKTGWSLCASEVS